MSWRTVLRANTYDVLAAYATANPNVLRAAYPVRPASFPSLPAAYVGDIVMRWAHDVGTRRVVDGATTVQVVIVEAAVDNTEAKHDIETIVDDLLEDFTALPHIYGGNTVASPVETSDTRIETGAVVYTGVVLTIGDIVIQEGRDF